MRRRWFFFLAVFQFGSRGVDGAEPLEGFLDIEREVLCDD
jgi:hypothetical protein